MGSSFTHAKFHKQHFLPTKILIKLSMCSQVLATSGSQGFENDMVRYDSCLGVFSPRFELFASPHDAISTLTSYPPPSLSVHLRPLPRPGPYLHRLDLDLFQPQRCRVSSRKLKSQNSLHRLLNFASLL
jgi:hypothetical protein